ncbi:MAG: class I SAM-dependent rRNA methyltransferase [Bdellovibrionota bacterium]
MTTPTAATKAHVWRLRAGADRRFRSGHPWVYSNELTESPKGVAPGDPVELRDAAGKFLARGYGNPHSLIAFRVLSRNPSDENPHTPEAVLTKLKRAAKLRADLGLGEFSHRLCYGESDGLPGLVIDRYVTAHGLVYVVQAHTAGMDRLMPEIERLLEGLTPASQWGRAAIVLRNDLSVRKFEGLTEEEPKILRPLEGADLRKIAIRVQPGLEFYTDLVEGQKTGFFLDQAGNIELASLRLRNLRGADAKSIRILDLCTYVGQWGAKLAHSYRAQGVNVHVTLVDASAKALEFAKRNVEAAGATTQILKGDVLKDLETLDAESFDLVVCDPPALIKSRKDLPQGKHAYLQLNTQAFRLVRKGGAVVSCSCSGLLEEEDFVQTLSKAAYRNKVQSRWIGRGSQAADHPASLEFPEGRYLKCWIGVID